MLLLSSLRNAILCHTYISIYYLKFNKILFDSNYRCGFFYSPLDLKKNNVYVIIKYAWGNAKMSYASNIS